MLRLVVILRLRYECTLHTHFPTFNPHLNIQFCQSLISCACDSFSFVRVRIQVHVLDKVYVTTEPCWNNAGILFCVCFATLTGVELIFLLCGSFEFVRIVGSSHPPWIVWDRISTLARESLSYVML
jgi:hypothetical protein